MKATFITFLLFVSAFLGLVNAYGQPINRQSFFKNDTIAALLISANLRNIDLERQKEIKRPGIARLIMPDSVEFSGPIELHGRGKIRYELCNPPPLMLYFKTKEQSSLRSLGKLKLVWGCRSGDFYDQLVIKEYLVYKMFNLLTPYSFRVRLLDIEFKDSSKAGTPIRRKGFLIEDIDELAKRNGLIEFEGISLMPGETNQPQYALVTVFQYMIANTDWSVSNYQNIKMVASDTALKPVPLIVPYDFDNCGLVNADYAVPHESLPIESVLQRYNKAVSLKKEDIHAVAEIFRQAQPALISIIEKCNELKPSNKKEMINYLNEFFRLLADMKTFDNIFLKQPVGSTPHKQ